MKKNIKRAPVEFWEDLYFQRFFFSKFLSLSQISDYHHLNGTAFGNMLTCIEDRYIYFEAIFF